MKAREIYGRYRQRFADLARGAADNPAWQDGLRELLAAFETETRALDSGSAALLRNELCEQLELAAYAAPAKEARDALLGAIKHIEMSG